TPDHFSTQATGPRLETGHRRPHPVTTALGPAPISSPSPPISRTACAVQVSSGYPPQRGIPAAFRFPSPSPSPHPSAFPIPLPGPGPSPGPESDPGPVRSRPRTPETDGPARPRGELGRSLHGAPLPPPPGGLSRQGPGRERATQTRRWILSPEIEAPGRRDRTLASPPNGIEHTPSRAQDRQVPLRAAFSRVACVARDLRWGGGHAVYTFLKSAILPMSDHARRAATSGLHFIRDGRLIPTSELVRGGASHHATPGSTPAKPRIQAGREDRRRFLVGARRVARPLHTVAVRVPVRRSRSGAPAPPTRRQTREAQDAVLPPPGLIGRPPISAKARSRAWARVVERSRSFRLGLGPLTLTLTLRPDRPVCKTVSFCRGSIGAYRVPTTSCWRHGTRGAGLAMLTVRLLHLAGDDAVARGQAPRGERKARNSVSRRTLSPPCLRGPGVQGDDGEGGKGAPCRRAPIPESHESKSPRVQESKSPRVQESKSPRVPRDLAAPHRDTRTNRCPDDWTLPLHCSPSPSAPTGKTPHGGPSQLVACREPMAGVELPLSCLPGVDVGAVQVLWVDLGHGTWDMGRGTWDVGRGTRDAGRGMWDVGRGTWDVGRRGEEMNNHLGAVFTIDSSDSRASHVEAEDARASCKGLCSNVPCESLQTHSLSLLRHERDASDADSDDL
ncbi:hypothetical protein JHW43_009648, partial [Diplocarpon mali]